MCHGEGGKFCWILLRDKLHTYIKFFSVYYKDFFKLLPLWPALHCAEVFIWKLFVKFSLKWKVQWKSKADTIKKSIVWKFSETMFSFQNSIYDWVRDHRVHHKFSETDADPHNSKRGFFFSHVGWLMQKKHPEVISKGKLVDLSDITNDPYLAFHTKWVWY